ncbi:FkbM family methyltransferase [Dokdonella sp.]|uniref:FkbM family methyltransferase n=1 Tax=Dokdonella sp. TaxID=2291710 RepID=UPI0027BB1122|nr:FkbM family methyltransferase [Dokdonella sp.]
MNTKTVRCVDEVDWRTMAAGTLARLAHPTAAASCFLTSAPQVSRFAIGKNNESAQLHAHTPLQGIIDDFAPRGSSWRGIPLVKTCDVPHDALIANCSTSISPVAVLAHLAAHDLSHVVGLHQLIVASAGKLAWPSFTATMRRELHEHPEVWKQIHDTLADEESRLTLRDVVRFRLSCDPEYMRSYTVRAQDQYFEEFMKFSNETFVDAGGFDGDTSEGFATRYPDYRKIFLFEPSTKNMEAAQRRLSAFRDIEFRPIGLSDTAGTLGFNDDGGSASAITRATRSTIDVDTLDAAVPESVSFIKMDLEGWEMNALQGARRHIAEERPKLAIAVYHDSADFRLVHQFVNAFGHDYRCYLRHYTQGWSETIMYFV